MAYRISEKGERLLRRGGADNFDDDELLLLELVKRAPGMSESDYKQAFVALRMEYGEEALRAVQTGHVQFELIAPQDQQ